MIVRSGEYPPNYEAIAAVFPIAGKAILFAYGNFIYNPSGGFIRDALIAHEQVHCAQQGAEIEKWWAAYLADPKFRLEQEIEAHRAEYQHVAAAGETRKNRRYYLTHCAKRLAGPVYGNMLTFEKARKLIKGRSDDA